ncbi:hypothetical protein ACFPYM_12295 [Methylobacterium hispanicum]
MVVDGGSCPNDVGSLSSLAALIETLGSLFRHGDPSLRLEEEALVESVVLLPEPRIVFRVPRDAGDGAKRLLAAVGRCVAAAGAGRYGDLDPHEVSLCGTLAAFLAGSGWEQLRMAWLEQGGESGFVIVPKELRKGFTVLGMPHLARVGSRR